MKWQSRWSFWRHVQKGTSEECWLWKLSKTPQGYPKFKAEGKQWLVGRLILEEVLRGSLGPGNPDNVVMHLCNNPPCCNPQHLKLGTSKENSAYAGSFGHLTRPRELNGNNKLSEREVTAIRSDNRSSRAVARAYGVGKSQILRIRRGEQWK